jgi:Rieske Fe-S protein
MHDQPAPVAAAPHHKTPRRAFLVRVIQGVHATIGATLAFILGGAVLAPSLSRRDRLWLSAGEAAALKEGEPLAVTLRVARQDGATEVVDRRVIYLVKSGDRIRAMDSTCTHLGCRTRFNAELRHIECPCHGGVYDLEGQVVSGPPPHGLDELPTRLDGTRVLVQV